MAARGHDCRALSTGVLDYLQETALEDVLAPLGVLARHDRADLTGDGTPAVFSLELGGVPVTLLRTSSSRIERSPDSSEAEAFLGLADRMFAEFRTHVLLTYGGRPLSLELMARARRRGIAVVFFLRNFAYNDRRIFADATAVLVPSEYSRRHYARQLGLACTALPSPLRLDQVVATAPEPRHLTFVNPLRVKGAAVFARIAVELQARRPEIPLLVVDSRGIGDGLSGVRLDPSGPRNLYRIPNVPNPQSIYRLSRAVLMPSLWRESFGRVAAEALANGLPVLASDRGALPETLGDAGFLFTIPEPYTPTSDAVPTVREVAPWVATVERLWDDPAWEASHQSLARESARRFAPDLLAPRYLDFFASLARPD